MEITTADVGIVARVAHVTKSCDRAWIAARADRILVLAEGTAVEGRGRSPASEISQLMLAMEAAA